MPGLDGIKATGEIARTRGLEQVRVLILTTYDTDAYVFEALQAGASGFLLKDAGPAELLHAIRVVAAGEALLAPRITRRLIAMVTPGDVLHSLWGRRTVLCSSVLIHGRSAAREAAPHGAAGHVPEMEVVP